MNELSGRKIFHKTASGKIEVANVADVAPELQNATATKVVEKENKTVKKSWKSLDELLKISMEHQPLRKIFGNYILEKNTVLFPSERGNGKTWLSMQIGYCVSHGVEEFLGEGIELHGPVLYFNLEMPESSFGKRMEGLRANTSIKQAPYPFLTYSEKLPIKELIKEIDEQTKAIKPVLVILDNLKIAFSQLDNESNKEMTNLIIVLNKLRDANNFSLLLLHHTKKGSSIRLTDSDLQSGAGSLTDLVDADFFLRKSKIDPKLRILKRIKSRYVEEDGIAKLIKINSTSQWFEMEEENVDESLHLSEDYLNRRGRGKLNAALKLKKQGKTLEQIGSDLGVDKSTVSRWFKPLNSSNQTPAIITEDKV